MVRWIVVLVVGLLLGFSSKKLSRSKLLQLLAINTALFFAFVGGALLSGVDLADTLTLNQSHITISALTVTYALYVGIIIKYSLSTRKESDIDPST
jgi:hypothetical protein